MRKSEHPRAKKKPPIPLAVNILRFQKYNFNFFATDEVIMFEYLTVKAQSFHLKWFYHSSAEIQEETGIKRSRLETILYKFENIKIVSIKVKGMPRIKYFKIHFEKIFTLLRKIYKFNNLSPENRKLLTDYFKALAENSKQQPEFNE